MLMHMHFITIVAFLIIENCYKYVKFKRHIKLFVTMVLFYNYKLLKIGKVFDLAKFLMLIFWFFLICSKNDKVFYF